MPVDTTKIRAYTNGLVAVSGYGVTNPALPTDATTALNGALYKELGALTDDGITDTTDQDWNDIFMWQGNALAATLPGQYTKTFKFACLEQNGQTLSLTYANSTLTQQSWGVSIAEKPLTRDVRTFILHGIDGGRLQRVAVPLGQVVNRGEVVWASTNATVFEYTVKCFVDSAGNVAYRSLYDPTLTL